MKNFNLPRKARHRYYWSNAIRTILLLCVSIPLRETVLSQPISKDIQLTAANTYHLSQEVSSYSGPTYTNGLSGDLCGQIYLKGLKLCRQIQDVNDQRNCLNIIKEVAKSCYSKITHLSDSSYTESLDPCGKQFLEDLEKCSDSKNIGKCLDKCERIAKACFSGTNLQEKQ